MNYLQKVSEVPMSSIISPEAIVYDSGITHPSPTDSAEGEDGVSASVLSTDLYM